MPMNIGSMLKITNAWNTFKRNHPKFPAFCRAVSRKGIREGSILEISYVTPGRRTAGNQSESKSRGSGTAQSVHGSFTKEIKKL